MLLILYSCENTNIGQLFTGEDRENTYNAIRCNDIKLRLSYLLFHVPYEFLC